MDLWRGSAVLQPGYPDRGPLSSLDKDSAGREVRVLQPVNTDRRKILLATGRFLEVDEYGYCSLGHRPQEITLDGVKNPVVER